MKLKLMTFMPKLEEEFKLQLSFNRFTKEQKKEIIESLNIAELVVLRELLDKDK